jgi:hypothetical protein
MSLCLSAVRRSRWLSSDSLTGVTTDQWCPTGQRWTLHHPKRSAFRDTPGIQSVLNRCPLPAANDHVAAERVPAQPHGERLHEESGGNDQRAASTAWAHQGIVAKMTRTALSFPKATGHT